MPNHSNKSPQPTGGSNNDNRSTFGDNSDNARPTRGDGNSSNPFRGNPHNDDQNSKSTSTIDSNNNKNQNNNNSPGGNQDNSPTSTVSSFGSLISNNLNSPFTTAVAIETSLGPLSLTATLVAGVPIQVGSSSVYVGGSSVALPTGPSTTLITIAGQTFAVRPSAIVAGSSTLTFQRAESVSYSTVLAATLPASTVTRDGIVITVQPTAAVVGGVTFPIGPNAPEATTVIDSQTITFNSNGVIFPSVAIDGAKSTNLAGEAFPLSDSPATTYCPALTTAPAYGITMLGGLTISIDSSEAIVSGTTYRIGPGGLDRSTTAVLDGTTLVFGPSGVVLPGSTTVKPTAPKLLVTASSGETSASAATRVVTESGATTRPTTRVLESSASATRTEQAQTSATAVGSEGPGVRVAVPAAYVPNAVCAVVVLLAGGMLPLSLVL